MAPAGGGPARGPFLARYESLEVKPQFQSRSVSERSGRRASSLYVADLELPETGRYEVLGVARLDDRLVAANARRAARSWPARTGPCPRSATAPR